MADGPRWHFDELNLGTMQLSHQQHLLPAHSEYGQESPDSSQVQQYKLPDQLVTANLSVYSRDLHQLKQKNTAVLSTARLRSSTEKPHQCPQCPKSFTRTFALQAHLRVHSNERPFKCEVCSRSFTRDHDRKMHQSIHTGAKKSTCQLCTPNCLFSNAASLKRHQKKQHCDLTRPTEVQAAKAAAETVLSFSTAPFTDRNSYLQAPIPYNINELFAASPTPSSSSRPAMMPQPSKLRQSLATPRAGQIQHLALQVCSPLVDDWGEDTLEASGIPRYLPAELPFVPPKQAFKRLIRLKLLEKIIKRNMINLDLELDDIVKDLDEMLISRFGDSGHWEMASPFLELSSSFLYGETGKIFDISSNPSRRRR